MTSVRPSQGAPDTVGADVGGSGDLVALAGPGRRRYVKPRSLDSHKLALLAIEKQAAKTTRTRMRASRTTVDKFRTARNQLRAVHDVSAKLAVRHALTEFNQLGITPAKAALPSSDYVRQLYDDLQQTLRDKTIPTKTKANRAALATVSAANRAYTDAQLALYKAAEATNPGMFFMKRWTTAPGEPCPLCTALDGQTIDLDDEFNYDGGVVYTDLQGPPRHPYCRCRIVVVRGFVAHP